MSLNLPRKWPIIFFLILLCLFNLETLSTARAHTASLDYPWKLLETHRHNLLDISSDKEALVVTEPKYIHKSLYIPPEVSDQLELLAIQERPAPGRKKKFNSLVLEGIELLLKDRGLPSILELTKKK